MFLDLHIHTCFSYDCLSSPDDVLIAAKLKGLDGIAVTDHDTIRGALETRKRNSDPGFLVIIGAEIATDAGDIIGLFLKEEIYSRSAADVVREIHEQEGLALLPHPFYGGTPRADIVRTVDLIEVFNARTSPGNNEQAAELARRERKVGVCASDSHFKSDVGTCGNLLDDIDTRAALLRGPRSLRTRYTRRYKLPASQIIKAWKTGHYSHIPFNALRIMKRIAIG
jgi:predicted metal-dependent phosphoesterase TrpH